MTGGRDPAPGRMVREGWNRASAAYRPDGSSGDAFGHSLEAYREWLEPLFRELDPGAPVLDLGCGCGVPSASLLASRFRVTGVDISDRQIERARALVPSARFIRVDMTRARFSQASFRAVVSLYSLIHVPLPLQRPLLSKIHAWLVPGSLFILIAGHDAWEGVEEDWLGSGAPMYWSHSDAATYRTWLEETGFEVLQQRFIPEGTSGHELFRTRSRMPVERTGSRCRARP